MKALFLGIDAGTTKVKSVAFDECGREVAISSCDTKLDETVDGSVTQDMNVLWDKVAYTISEVVKATRDIGEIKALGCTGQGAGIWLLDEDKKPITDAILWTDGRSSGIIEKWKDEGILKKSGRLAFSGCTLALNAWSYENMPDVMEKARHSFFCKDWIKYCLTGEIVTDISDLADSSIVDVWSRQYSREHLGTFGVEQLTDLLPPIKPSIEIIGSVTKKAAEETGLAEGTPVVNGMIDVAATAFGNGMVNEMDSCSIVGTTLYSELVVKADKSMDLSAENAPSIVCFIDDKWILSLGTMFGCPNLDWFIRTAYGDGEFSFSEEEEKMKKIAPGSDGLIFHPFLGMGGERAPFVKADAAGDFFGIKNNHTRAHLLRAVYEGIGYSMKDCYENFPSQPEMVRLAGGGSNSAFWSQIFADCLNRPVQITAGTEIGARGSALMAAIATGHFGSIDEGINSMIQVKSEYEPDAKVAAIYDEYYRLYKELYLSNWNMWDKLSELKNKYTN